MPPSVRAVMPALVVPWVFTEHLVRAVSCARRNMGIGHRPTLQELTGCGGDRKGAHTDCSFPVMPPTGVQRGRGTLQRV